MLATGQSSAADKPQEIVVTENRSPISILEIAGNTAQINDDEIRITNPNHPYELGVRVPGVWISRGSGQEHLTAVRSPVLTGPGSCGGFLVMENSVATRPAGFCNANQLMEIPVDQAANIEIIRGPAGALYGSNGLHGTINVMLPEPGINPGLTTSLEVGSNDFWRARALWDSAAESESDRAWNAGLTLDSDGGYREDSGEKQARGFWNLQQQTKNGTFKASVSGSLLDQETAGFIRGDKDIYKDPAINRTNPNPEAYRKASSLRAQASWLPDSDGPWNWRNTGYLRWSDMDFLMHFLPGQPREQNGQVSGGYMLFGQRDSIWDSLLTTGLDLELASAYMDQFQDGPTAGGGRRPEGQQYDYDVWSFVAAPYARLQVPLGERVTVTTGLRVEYMRYDYTNNMLDGNTKDDGTDCTNAAGCLYFRPESQSNDFLNAAPELGIVWRAAENISLFSNLRRGFRAPQATELYRLQAEQTIGQVKSETIDSFEIGVHGQQQTISYELLTFAMRKDNYILQDSNRRNINDGKSNHIGIEAGFTWRIVQPVYMSFAGTWAKHTYDFNSPVVTSGDRIDTAPDLIGSMQIGYEASFGRTELEWVHNDKYFLETTNTSEYEGHDLLNWRLIIEPGEQWWAALRVNNITDEVYADRADFAFGSYRYFPGRSREYFLQIGYRTASKR